MGWSSQVVVANKVVIEGPGDSLIVTNTFGAQILRVDGASDALFVYADTGSATQGALICSMAGRAGTDPLSGTAYPQGFGVTAGSIPGGLINAHTITATQILAQTITALQIAAGTITGGNIAAATISGLNTAACFHGLNMIPDPQFSNSALNTVRLADPQTTFTWTFSSGTVQINAGSLARLALLPSAGQSIWVNPGEQYFLSVKVTTTAAVTVGIELADGGGGIGTVQQVVNGPNVIVSGVVTVPSGHTSAYIRLFTVAGGSGVVTFSNPVCTPAQLSGSDWIINQHGLFFYSAAPASGNLALSISQFSGTDAFSNGYPSGVAVFSGGSAQLTGGTLSLGSGSNSWGLVPFLGGPSFNIPYLAVSGPLNSGVTIAYFDQAGNLVANQPTSPVSETPEVWHTMSLLNSWAAAARITPKYRLLVSPPNTVEVIGSLTAPAGIVAGQVIWDLPTGYTVAGLQSVVARNVSTNAAVMMSVVTGSPQTLQFQAGAVAGNIIDFHAFLSMDA